MYRSVLPTKSDRQEAHTSEKAPRFEVARQSCIATAVKTVDSISTFCTDTEVLHQGLSWYATYFLFQAILVLDIALLHTSTDCHALEWKAALEQGRLCLRLLGGGNDAASRCLSVFDRIHHRHAASHNHHHNQQTQFAGPLNLSGDTAPVSNTFDGTRFNPLPYAIDPAVHPFIDSTSFASLFDEVTGFPGTNEGNLSEYIPGSFINSGESDAFWHVDNFDN